CDPNYASAVDYYEKWHEAGLIEGIPKGNSSYAQAKRAHLVEKDPERAVQFYQQSIRLGEKVQDSVRELVAVLDDLGRTREALDVLSQNAKMINDDQWTDNAFGELCRKLGDLDEAILLLQKRHEQASTVTGKAQALWNIAYSYLERNDYANAEKSFRGVLKFHANHKAALRNVAICLFKQQLVDEAQELLENMVDSSPDPATSHLLQAITQA